MQRARWLVVLILGCGPSAASLDDELGDASTSDASTTDTSTSDTSTTDTSDTSTSDTSTSDTSTTDECPTQLFGDVLIDDATDLDTLACLVEAEFLTIEGSFTDLSFLHTLERADWLVLHDTPQLIDLGGLDSLEQVDTLIVRDAPSMVDLAGLPADVVINRLYLQGDLAGLVSIAMPPMGARALGFGSWQRPDLALLATASPAPTSIVISGAPLLTDLDDVAQCCLAQQAELRLELSDTPLLTALQGLEPFTTLAYFKLSENPEVVSLAGLAGLEIVGELRLDDFCFPFQGAKLADLQGLEQLVQVDTLVIDAQGGLVSLEGLPSDLVVGSANFSYNLLLDQALIDAWAASAMPGTVDGCDNLDGPACEGLCPQ